MSLRVATPTRGTRLTRSLPTWVLAASCLSCTHVDPVFEVVVLAPPHETVRVNESAGVVSVPLQISGPARARLRATFFATDAAAQSGCQVPDYRAPGGFIEWAPGSVESSVQVWIENDQLAETDESFKIVFRGEAPLDATAAEIEIEIVDDDRTALIDARAYGLAPGTATSSDRPLQAALDAAAQSGRGVVVLAPGDYEITGVHMAPGTTLSGSGARLRRPPASADDARTVSVTQDADVDSLPTLIERLTLDGRKDQQGPFKNYERQRADLIAARGVADKPGLLRITLENVALASGTADGVMLSTNVDATLCRLEGSDLWREMVGVYGGNTRVRMRDIEASAVEGTTGLWFNADMRGHGDTLRMDVQLEDVRLNTGDLEIGLAQGSSMNVRNLLMTAPPFRLVAPGSVVRIADSVVSIGIAGEVHDYFGALDDVEFSGTTLRFSELDGTQRGLTVELPEADRTLSLLTIRPEVPPRDPPPSGQLRISDCRFETAQNVEPGDVVFAVGNAAPSQSVAIRGSFLGSGMAGWFSPGCTQCRVEP